MSAVLAALKAAGITTVDQLVVQMNMTKIVDEMIMAKNVKSNYTWKTNVLTNHLSTTSSRFGMTAATAAAETNATSIPIIDPTTGIIIAYRNSRSTRTEQQQSVSPPAEQQGQQSFSGDGILGYFLGNPKKKISQSKKNSRRSSRSRSSSRSSRRSH